MIPQVKPKSVISGGIDQSGQFGISQGDAAHLMRILRNQLYSDKILAVLREYSCNAWDANREAGNGDKPFTVHLPDHEDENLVIRDFGKGLSKEGMFQVFTQYGASTKRDSNAYIGALGIGAKSAFSYTNCFTIISRHEGMKCTYEAALDESDIGVLNLLIEQKMLPGVEESGLEIIIPVKASDFDEFRDTAADLYTYFVPQPEVNCTINQPFVKRELWLPEGAINIDIRVMKDADYTYSRHRHRDDWTVVMGGVSYKLDIDQLTSVDVEDQFPAWIRNRGGVIFCEIGEISVSASREQVEYTDHTKTTIARKIQSLVDRYTTMAVKHVEEEAKDDWSKRWAWYRIREYGFDIETEDKYTHTVTMPKDDDPDAVKTFFITREPKEYTHAKSIGVEQDLRFIIKDNQDKRSPRYFAPFRHYSGHNLLVVPIGAATVADVEKELTALLTKWKITGVPVALLSSFDYLPPEKGTRSTNVKHRKIRFRFVSNKHHSYKSPRSRHWEVDDKEPADDDVFVIVDSFKTYMFDRIESDLELLKELGGTLPEIYGYKSTEKKPVNPKDCKGKEYKQWLADYVLTLAKSKEVEDQIDNWLLRKGISANRIEQTLALNIPSGRDTYHSPDDLRPVRGDKLHGRLRTGHPIMVYLDALAKTHKQPIKKRLSSGTIIHVINLTGYGSEGCKHLNELRKSYPLIAVSRGNFTNAFIDDNADEWIRYVKMVDALRGRKRK